MRFSRFGKRSDFDEWVQKLHDIMDEMLKRSFVDFRHTGEWQPATNVYESRECYYICVELAGVERDRIDVECIEGTRVLLRGTRDSPRPADTDAPLSVHVLEIDEGAFRREIDLPEPVDVERIDARHRQGYLWIRLPKIIRS